MLSPTLKRLHHNTLTTLHLRSVSLTVVEEIIDAVKSVAVDHASGNLDIDSIGFFEITNRMYASGNLPDPDLVIRTSGEERIEFLAVADCLF